MTVRKVVTRRSCHFRGFIPSQKNGKPIPWESQLEGVFLSLLELSPQVLRYDVQPSKEIFAMGDDAGTYYPDVRAVLRDGSERWFEVKPAAKLSIRYVSSRLKAIGSHFQNTNRVFSVVTDEQLMAEPFVSNLRNLMYYRRSSMLINFDSASIESMLEIHQPKTIHELCGLVGNSRAWHLLGQGSLGVDLDKPVIAGAPIYLQGGHRHGNFFS